METTRSGVLLAAGMMIAIAVFVRWLATSSEIWLGILSVEEMSVVEHEFKIVDHKARQAFEELLGIKLYGPVVRLMHDKYVEHAAAIQAIQSAAALRVRR
jgi:hypothetical protein